MQQDPRERIMTPQETELDLPVGVQEPLVESWADGGLPQGQGIEYHSPGSPGVCWH